MAQLINHCLSRNMEVYRSYVDCVVIDQELSPHLVGQERGLLKVEDRYLIGIYYDAYNFLNYSPSTGKLKYVLKSNYNAKNSDLYLVPPHQTYLSKESYNLKEEVSLLYNEHYSFLYDVLVGKNSENYSLKIIPKTESQEIPEPDNYPLPFCKALAYDGKYVSQKEKYCHNVLDTNTA